MNYFAPLSSFKAKYEKIKKGNTTALAKRRNDFSLLEDKSKRFKSESR